MTREGVMGFLRTMGVVLPVTLLIWLLAESESTRQEKVRVELSVAAGPESARAIRVVPGQDFAGVATVQIEGANAKVDALIGRIRAPLRLEPGAPGVPLDPGTHAIDLQQALSQSPLLRESGVVVMAVEPATVLVQIDPVAQVEAKVRVELPSGAGMEGAIEVTPATVTLRVPEPAVRQLERDGQLEVVARIPPAALVGLPEGRRSMINAVPIELPPAVRDLPGVRLMPAQVSVGLTPRARVISLVIASVPVHVRIAASELDRWEIELSPESRTLTNVTVTGPSELMETLRGTAASQGGSQGPAGPSASPAPAAGAAQSGAAAPTAPPRLIAYVPLSFDELERAVATGGPDGTGVIEKEPVFTDVPTPIRFESPTRSVRVLVRRRADP